MAVLRAQQHLAVAAAGDAIVDDQRSDDPGGVERAISDRLRHIDIAAMPLHALSGIAAVAPDMPAGTGVALADRVVGRRVGQNFAPAQWRQAGLAFERGDGIIQRGNALSGLQSVGARFHQYLAAIPAALRSQLLRIPPWIDAQGIDFGEQVFALGHIVLRQRRAGQPDRQRGNQRTHESRPSRRITPMRLRIVLP